MIELRHKRDDTEITIRITDEFIELGDLLEEIRYFLVAIGYSGAESKELELF